MPAVNRSDQPYPLRTIDGEVTVVADEVYTEDLYATGLSTFEDIYVLGTANLQGEAISLSDITADSLVVLQDTSLNTLTTTGTSNLADTNTQALSSTGLTVNGNITVPQVSNGIISAPFITSGSWTLGQALRVSSVNQAAVSYPNTGTGNNVQQTSPTLITPNIGAATGTSLSLSTPLSPASGGTGVTSLGLLNVGSALAIAGGNTGQVPVQLGSSSTGFIVPATTDRPLCSNGVGVLPTFKNLNLVTAVTGILGVANGGTGTATATGTGDNVKAVSPTIVTPTLLAPLCDTLTATDTINSGKTTNATSASTGAITATNGGIGCAQDIWAGGRVIANSANDATNTTDGAIRSFGGASILKNIVAGGVIQSNIVQNATSTVTGALRAIAGGLSCALDAFIGGKLFVKSLDNATSTITGAVQVDGGASVKLDIYCGENVSADAFTARDTTQATGALTGAIISSGGISALRNIYAVEKVIASDFKLISQSNDLNFDMGTFVPFLQSDTPANTALIPTITYTTQEGYWQNCNQFTFIYMKLEWTIPSGMPGVPASVGGIPGTYFSRQSMTFSDASIFYITPPQSTEHLQPFQLAFSPISNRWLVQGFRQNIVVGMVNTVKVYDGTGVGDSQRIIISGVLCRTTI